MIHINLSSIVPPFFTVTVLLTMFNTVRQGSINSNEMISIMIRNFSKAFLASTAIIHGLIHVGGLGGGCGG